MNKHTWKTYAVWILFVEAVGGLSSWLTRDGVKVFQQTAAQPDLSPPQWVFPVVWGILYALMGYSAARVYRTPASNARSRGLLLFLIQLTVNFFWSIFFFNLQNYALAFFWLLFLWGLVLWMILAFYRVDKTAALLQIPYLLWLSFALYLNYGIWMLN